MIRQSDLVAWMLVACPLCAACDRDPSKTTPPESVPVVPPAATTQPAPTPPAPPAKADPVDAAALKEGLTAMSPRLVAQVDAYKKIEPNQRSRYFMHPDEDKSASIEFDTKGLTSLDLAPYIEDFSLNQDCAPSPKAGVVQLTWFIDGKKKGNLTVDRDYKGTMTLNVEKSTKLKLEVDKGNDVTWCDWFSVGFLNVK